MKPWLVLVVVLAACGPLTPPKTDAGTGGGSGGGAMTGGGSATGGGGAVTGGGGGSTGGGGGSTGGGGATGGGDGTWDFGTMTLNPAPGNAGSIVGFAETDAGIFAISSSGRLYRSTGGPFAEQFAFPGLQPRDFEGSASGHLFMLTTVNFLHCATNCADAGAWAQTTISAGDEVLNALCVIGDDHVLALGGKGGADNGVSYRWNGTQLAASGMALGFYSPRNCWKGASGDFFIPVDDNVLRYSTTTEGFTAEPTGTMAGWRGGGSSPGHEWVSGLGPVISERGASSWATAFNPSGTSGAITAIIGVSPTLAFGFGGGFTSDGQSGYRYDGVSWSAMNPDLPSLNQAASAFRTSAGVIYVGGNDASQMPIIVRGARR